MLRKIFERFSSFPSSLSFLRKDNIIDLTLEDLSEIIYHVEELEGRTIEEYYIEKPFSRVKIKVLPNEILYELIVPPNPLPPREYDDFKRYVFHVVSKYTTEVDESSLWNAFLEVVSRKYRHMSKEELGALWYSLYNDCLRAGKITPLLMDPNIEDVTCNGYNLPVYVYHKKYTYLKTNVIFTQEELDDFVTTICNKQGVDVTLSNPIVDLVLYDGSRINITYKDVVSGKGTTFTIRKLKEKPYTPAHLIIWNTASIELFAYASLAIDFNASIMVIGATASGKTTTLNALALLIPPSSKIVSIEDTREIQLPHENWTPLVTTPDIDAFQLVITSLRQRPDYIIVGESRGKETVALFQAMSTGHPCLTTMHAGSAKEIVKRLNSPPLNIQASSIPMLNVIVTMSNVGTKEKPLRRVVSAHFVLDSGNPDEKVIDGVYLRKILDYDYDNDAHIFNEELALECLSSYTGRSVEYLRKQYRLRLEFLKQVIELDACEVDKFFNVLKEFKIQNYEEKL